jgi:hypothetical protein
MRTMAVREYRSTRAALGRTGQQRGVRFYTLWFSGCRSRMPTRMSFISERRIATWIEHARRVTPVSWVCPVRDLREARQFNPKEFRVIASVAVVEMLLDLPGQYDIVLR